MFDFIVGVSLVAFGVFSPVLSVLMFVLIEKLDGFTGAGF